MERMLRSRHDISEMKERLGITSPSPHMDKTLAFNRRRYVQLVRALLKKDLVTLVEVDEVHEHAEVFLVENRGQTHSDGLLARGSVTWTFYLHRGSLW